MSLLPFVGKPDLLFNNSEEGGGGASVRTLPQVPPREVRNGRHHDLQQLTDQIHRTHFATAPRLPVRWGKQVTTTRKRRSIRLGSYDHSTTIIRIHPSLDAPHVPPFFIQSIIYHEYLHHILGAPHNARFHRHERQFPFHREAREWLKLNLPVLLGRKKVKAVREKAAGPVRPAIPRPVPRPRAAVALPPRPIQLSLF